MADSIKIATCANDDKVELKATLTSFEIRLIINALDNHPVMSAAVVAHKLRDAIAEDAINNPDSVLFANPFNRHPGKTATVVQEP